MAHINMWFIINRWFTTRLIRSNPEARDKATDWLVAEKTTNWLVADKATDWLVADKATDWLAADKTTDWLEAASWEEDPESVDVTGQGDHHGVVGVVGIKAGMIQMNM